MSELEKLELAKAKSLIKLYGWDAQILGFEQPKEDPKEAPAGYEKLNDGNIFVSVMSNNKKTRDHYIGVVDGDNKLEDHRFQVPKKPRVYISSNSEIKKGDTFELFKVIK